MKQIWLILVFLFLTACRATPTTSVLPDNDLEAAQAALVTYLSALQSGEYDQAVQLYGGSYELLQGWNPDLDAENYPRLLERACTQNGLQCLPLRAITAQGQSDPNTFEFWVEFTAIDGTLFRRGPCCGAGETEESENYRFVFRVQKTEDRFRVLDLPPYVP
jgi:hypothetical protein